MTMDKRSEKTIMTSSHLFTVRIWQGNVGEDHKEWRGKVEQVLSGKACYFRDWSTLVAFLEESLAELYPDNPSPQAQNKSITSGE